MNLNFGQQDIAFRSEVRQFLSDSIPGDIRSRIRAGERLGKADRQAWHRILARRGWAGVNWPVEHGGTGWSATQKFIFAEEYSDADAPALSPFGLAMVAPVLFTYGSAEQQRRFLPPILAGDEWWCQGYSEPGAGSDLAALSTRAVRQGDEYVVTGTKTWTTEAQHADWIFCLVRTDSRAQKQAGISFLLIDMQSPGVTVRPIITIEGSNEVNEVHLQDVRVPLANRVGEENQGWTYAKALLTHERTGIAGLPWIRQQLRRLKASLAIRDRDCGRQTGDVAFRMRLAQLEVDLLALQTTELRVLATVATGRAPGPESSLLKIRGTEIQQRLSELFVEAAGPYGQEWDRSLPVPHDPVTDGAPSWALPLYFNHRKATIFGGSSEIQRNIIAKAVLGL